MPQLTVLFLALILAAVITRLWLARRQIRHVIAHRAEVPVEFRDRIGLRSHQRAADYTVARMRLGMLEIALDTAVLLVLTLGGGLQWLWAQAHNLLGTGIAAELLFVAQTMVVLGVIQLPVSLYRQFRLEQRFGFNRMTLRLFVSDTLKGALLAIVLGVPVLTLILWLMQMTGQYWWLWAWGVWMGFNVLVMLIFPTWIAPLFNKFTPLKDEAVRERVQALAQRCNFPLQGLFVMDGSKRSAHGNAYFTGLGKSRRIVFFDTLLNKLTPEEIEAVLAHELGHFKHHHITKRIVLGLLAALLFFVALGWLSQEAWFYTGLGVAAPATGHVGAMALVLFTLTAPLATFWLTPLINALSRRDEFEADRFAARQSDADHLIRALVKLFDDNAATLTPDPIHSAFYDTHPPAALRIRHLAYS